MILYTLMSNIRPLVMLFYETKVQLFLLVHTFADDIDMENFLTEALP